MKLTVGSIVLRPGGRRMEIRRILDIDGIRVIWWRQVHA